MDELVLLGRWAETPLITWPGYCNEAQDVYYDRTGFRPEPFTLLRDGLHEQYYLRASVDPLREWFAGISPSLRAEFVRNLYKQYYRDASALEQLTSRLAQTNIVKTSIPELRDRLGEWMRLPARLAPPIFFSVLLDIWYAGEKQAEIVDIIPIAAAARDHCANVYDIQAKREAERLFSEISTRLGTTWDQLQMLFPDEILAWLDGDTHVANSIEPRQEFFITENRNGLYSIIDGEEAGDRLSQVILAELGEPQDHLQGLPAYAGSVQGPAKRVLSTEDTLTFQDGYVLVAYQTSVWYEPLFERATAVLTELGGATSHAAVVCAERRLPCIVGIPNLVRSVTNGDHLVIDASVGTVDIQRTSKER